MEAKATARYILISPTKARLVVDLIRRKPVEEALAVLRYTPRRAARAVEKVLRSAIANAEHNRNLSRADLVVAEARVDPGPILKRWHPRQRGMAFPILKRMSHITVVVKDGGAASGDRKAAGAARARPVARREAPARAGAARPKAGAGGTAARKGGTTAKATASRARPKAGGAGAAARAKNGTAKKPAAKRTRQGKEG